MPSHRSALKQLLSWVLVLPFLAQSLLAEGTMLSSDSQGITMVICTGDEFETIVIGADGEPLEPQTQNCDWSTVAGVNLAAELFHVALTLAFLRKAHFQPTPHPVPARPEANAAFSRAPPVLI
ncbi:MAG: hypothetical protein ACFB11_12685 [Paracoccaceae bacterium]